MRVLVLFWFFVVFVVVVSLFGVFLVGFFCGFLLLLFGVFLVGGGFFFSGHFLGFWWVLW